MYCEVQMSKNNQRTKRFTVLILLVCFIMFFLLLSEAFLLIHAEHEHDHKGIGGSCNICVQLHNAESLLKHLGMAVAAISLGFISLLTAMATIPSVLFSLGLCTPIKLKTRINN